MKNDSLQENTSDYTDNRPDKQDEELLSVTGGIPKQRQLRKQKSFRSVGKRKKILRIKSDKKKIME